MKIANRISVYYRFIYILEIYSTWRIPTVLFRFAFKKFFYGIPPNINVKLLRMSTIKALFINKILF